jgi:hypothetical protein
MKSPALMTRLPFSGPYRTLTKKSSKPSKKTVTKKGGARLCIQYSTTGKKLEKSFGLTRMLNCKNKGGPMESVIEIVNLTI